MSRRSDAADAFLAAAGWAGATIEPLAADASFRRYDRIHLNNGDAVLMDAPPPKEDVRPFVRIAKYLTQLGFSAPRLLAENTERGFLLLEDLGDATYTRVLADGGSETELYALAVDTLVRLHEVSSPSGIPAGVPAYDIDALLAEAMLFIDWYLPAVTGERTDPDLRAAFEAAWRDAFSDVAGKRESLVLRDYHIDNLMLLPERAGTARCGLLDFQDALVGARAYDLMSLVEDARRDIELELRDVMIQRYLMAFPDMNAFTFYEDIAVLGAGRHAKVIGIFTRLAHRDGKAQYLAHIPRVWRLLERSLTHPRLGGIAKWFETHVPTELRIIPGPVRRAELSA